MSDFRRETCLIESAMERKRRELFKEKRSGGRESSHCFTMKEEKEFNEKKKQQNGSGFTRLCQLPCRRLIQNFLTKVQSQYVGTAKATFTINSTVFHFKKKSNLISKLLSQTRNQDLKTLSMHSIKKQLYFIHFHCLMIRENRVKYFVS